MHKKVTVFFSNSVEVLFEHLKINLFSKESDIFSQRIVIAPSLAMQQWIQLHLASALSISSGMTLTFLDKAVDILLKNFFNTTNKGYLPSQLDLLLKIEHELDLLLEESNPLWQPLKKYLKNEGRKFDLSKVLAQFFVRYGIYGDQAPLEWEKNPKEWQQALWAKIFAEWNYPLRSFSRLHSKPPLQEVSSIHLFAFSHLSPLHFNFFKTLGTRVPVYLYQLSPCQEFWSDLSFEDPTLLGSLGKVGRHMAKMIEESDCSIEENYLLFGGSSQLKKLQRELVTLQPTPEIHDDDSIEVYVAKTPHEEIATLYRILQPLLQKGIEPKDIIVMAPSIETYAPYIRSLFGKRVAYQIADMPLLQGDSVLEGLFLLLDLENQRWSAPAVMELLEHPLFKAKHRLDDTYNELVRDWVQATGIVWGFNKEHRITLLKEGNCLSASADDQGTWMAGLGRLIEELALPPFFANTERITLSQAETLGHFVELLKNLYVETRPFEQQKRVSEWVCSIRQLAQKYFYDSDSDTALESILEKVDNASRNAQSGERLYSFSFFRRLLEECITIETQTVNRNQIQAIRFCSLLPMRAIPAKVICLIGMNDNDFPRQEKLQWLDLLNHNSATRSHYFPSRLDFDRFLVLEALLSVRERMVISYLGQDPYDHTELLPSSIVAEIQTFLSPARRKRELKSLGIWREGDHATPFSVSVKHPFHWPQGEIFIDIQEMNRLTRSAMNHYFYFRGLRMWPHPYMASEESFMLSPLKKKIYRKLSLSQDPDEMLDCAEREGLFPPGIFGTVAKLQLLEQRDPHPKKPLMTHLKPISFQINSGLSVVFTGSLETLDESLFILEKNSFKGAIKAWPQFLVWNSDKEGPKNLYFADSDLYKSPFFDEVTPLLTNYMEFFFYTQRHPLPIVIDWIEPMLKRDSTKLIQTPVYDPFLQWQLGFKKEIDTASFFEICTPLLQKVYQEMYHAWFE